MLTHLEKCLMIFLHSGYRCLKRLFPFWFLFFNYLKLESFQVLFLITMGCPLQSLWQSESKKYQPFQALAWADCLNLPADCHKGMQIACPPSPRMPRMTECCPWALKSGTSNSVRVLLNRSQTEAISHPLDFCSLRLSIFNPFHYFMWDPWFLTPSIHS